jgi:hypothetical protein
MNSPAANRNVGVEVRRVQQRLLRGEVIEVCQRRYSS